MASHWIQTASHWGVYEVETRDGIARSARPVAWDAACTAGGAAARMASTRVLTRSSARAGKRDRSPSARRVTNSMPESRRWPASFKPSRIAVMREFTAADCPGCSTPSLRLFLACCARAPSGHAAAPPGSVMNSRHSLPASHASKILNCCRGAASPRRRSTERTTCAFADAPIRSPCRHARRARPEERARSPLRS